MYSERHANPGTAAVVTGSNGAATEEAGVLLILRAAEGCCSITAFPGGALLLKHPMRPRAESLCPLALMIGKATCHNNHELGRRAGRAETE